MSHFWDSREIVSACASRTTNDFGVDLFWR